MSAPAERVDVAVIGAGPCGLAAAIAFKRAGLRAVVLDRSCVTSGIALYPPYMTFFSTAERIAIGGMPFVVAAEKPTRRDALAYYRAVVSHFDLDVRQYEEVVSVERVEPGGGWGVEGGAATRDRAAEGERAPGHDRSPEDDPTMAGASGGSAGGAGRAVRAAAGVMRAAARAVRAAARQTAGGRGAPPEIKMAAAGRDGGTAATPAGASERGGGARGAPPARFVVHSAHRTGRQRTLHADAVVVATGYFGTPSRLGVPGEDLPHVSHYFTEGHYAFRQDAIVVGGGNSAVDAALELYRAGARVTMVHFGPGLDPNIKPWVLPDIANRIKDGSIAARWHSRVARIDPEGVTIRSGTEGDPGAGAEGTAGVREERLPADHVFLATGFLPNTRLLEQLGVPLDPGTGVPAHDPATMETAVPGVFIAGVIASGFDANRIFIENGRDHGTLIAARLAAGR